MTHELTLPDQEGSIPIENVQIMKPFTKNASWITNRNALELLPVIQVKLFACDVARLSLPIYEQYYPQDKRPRVAIDTAELFLYGKTTKKQLQKTYDDATHAANTAWSSMVSNKYSKCSSKCSKCNMGSMVSSKCSKCSKSSNNICNAATNVANIGNIHDAIHAIFLQTTTITIPTTPTLQSIAQHIAITRNFQEYYVLLDNLEEFHNIQLERTVPKGLSHYVLYTLTNTN